MSVIDQFAGVRVLCLGDVMLDRFVMGAARRISPESPVPVLSVTGSTTIAGGSANVARNIASLGGRCTLVGVIGADSCGAELKRILDETPGVASTFVEVPQRPTTEKIRFVAQGQHMLRSDSEDNSPVAPDVEEAIVARIAAALPEHDVVVLSDYAKGVLTTDVIRRVVELATRRGAPVIVDPKSSDLARYDGATLVTPNLHETYLATGIQGDDDASAVAAARKVLAGTTIGAVLVTRSEKGMTLVQRTAEPVHIPTAAREVADVVGAGDTVIAALSLVVGAGGDLQEAAYIANAAAGVVVGKRGTATVSRDELLAELDRQSYTDGNPSSAKVVSRAEAAAQVAAWQRHGLAVGFTNGCFDIVHVGHVGIIEFSRAHCDRLVVAVNSDASVKRLKGPSRPVNGEMDRAQVIAALGAVDLVVVFDEDTPKEIIEELQPDVLVKGADYQVSEIVGADSVLARGGRVLRFELVPGRSTTKVISRMTEGVSA
ncbi:MULTISPECIES: D-glycero-beta-D-manno-heptose-7-phosphate kinase [Xanthobacter]|uniref:Bifunctional protein HldE n=1 Tax=Xanthobacter aminoxidans TaxID=186280 RepID=A0ABW6ZDZ7_9HYPH|nr:D-glycero-beta-D-manno-heptose-7-phosphate kinase [Xanthobacter sp. 91]